MKNLERAYEIALRDLRACYSQNGILAGKIKFDDYWARDSFFASLGSIMVKDYSVVRSNFNLFLNKQKENGQLPRKIRNHFTPLKYLGIRAIKRDLSPRYRNSIYSSSTVDQNSLMIISMLYYIKKTKDFEYVERNYPKLKKAMDWNFTQYNNNLIKQGLFSDWEDTTIKRKYCLYPNILHYGAVYAFIDICKLIDKNYFDYEEKAKLLKEEINKKFWNGNYYCSWENSKYIDIPGNILAILFNITDEEKSDKILNYIKNLDLGIGSYPTYPFYRYAPWHFLRGTKRYHNGFSWLWITCLHVTALMKAGDEKQAKEVLSKIADLIVKHEGVHEVYFDGKPVNKRFFKAEVPFAWSAGLFVFAYNQLTEENNKISYPL